MRLLFCSIIMLLWIPLASSQLPAACGGGSAPAIACNQACINCNFNGYTGNTTGFPSGVAPEFCGTIENAQWLGFIAGEAQATFIITPFNCTNNNGVQVALYNDCTKAPLACDKGMKNGGGIPVAIDVPLAPGGNYFLLIDGYAGDFCDFTVTVSPATAVYQAPLGDIQPITGPTKGCAGAQFEYSVPPVLGASAYLWSGPPGAMFDSVPSPAVLIGADKRKVQVTLGNQSGDICVQAANTCSKTAPCASSIYVEILDDSHRPVLASDTLQHLNCLNPAVALALKVIQPGNFLYHWVSDSAGHIVKNENTPYPAVNRPGIYTVTVTNPENGCASTQSIRVTQPDQTSQVNLAIQPVTCYGYDDGRVRVQQVQGGKAPFFFKLDSLNPVPFPVFENLKPGDHSLSITGSNGCTWDTTFYITQPDTFILDLGPDISISPGESLVLWKLENLNDPERVKTIQVYPAWLQAGICDTCSWRALQSIWYQLTVLDSNGCRAIDD
ncbi:MAG: hypothetical protein KGS48_04595, partial [Bacteroidetes bacterium]|nr:hypothetical protein [Bacteroidota bacterium]